MFMAHQHVRSGSNASEILGVEYTEGNPEPVFVYRHTGILARLMATWHIDSYPSQSRLH